MYTILFQSMLGNKTSKHHIRLRWDPLFLCSCYNRMAQFSVSDPANGSRSVNGTLLKKQTNKQTTKQKQNREYFVLIIANTCEVDHLNLSKKIKADFPTEAQKPKR